MIESTMPNPYLSYAQVKIYFSLAHQNHKYIEGTVPGKALTPRSYLFEAQGRTYCCIHQYIHPLSRDTTSYSRPSTFQEPEPEKKDATNTNNVNACTNHTSFSRPMQQSTPAKTMPAAHHTPFSKTNSTNPTMFSTF